MTNLRSLIAASCLKPLLHMSKNFKAGLAFLFVLLGLGLSPAAQSATLGLVIATDNTSEVYLNGVLLGTASNWMQSSNYSAALQSGTNVLAVKGIDMGGPAGLIAELTLPSGKLVSDASWKVSTTAPAGWEAAGFNDSAWSAASPYGAYGSGPWNNNVSGFPNGSTANWIWTADNNNDDTAYFRYTFTVESAPLAMSTSTLPNGVVGSNYSQALSATGGTPPYAWSITAGSLPAGLSLNTGSTISGTPSAAGTSTFTVRVTDATNATADRAFTLTVTSAPPATLGLVVATDDTNEVYLNGVLLGTASNWTQSSNYNAALQSGTNVLAVKAIDTGGPAGMIAELTLPSGKVVSDTGWKVSTTAPAGWEAVGFNDSAWSAASQYGAYGSGPWYNNVSGFPNGSTANWIWTADNNNNDTAYFRYTFTVGSAPPGNVAPTVSITGPANGSTHVSGEALVITANAADSDGSIASVAFYANGALLYTATSTPYKLTTSLAAGSYSITAIATDNQGATTTSAPVNITVTPAGNVAPTVSMTSPADGSSYTAPANITLSANAADSDGTITAVEFYNGATLIGSVTTPPYTATWSNAPLGNYSVRARAVDNQGAATYSNTIAVNVNAVVASSVYYLYADHLNTPRVITDTSNKVVWRWDSDPFGADAANEDPDGDGTKFRYNPRFPGQYFDRETGLHYNYFRDYEPTSGRYVQSDPIGLAGGLNGYLYANANPLTFIDPLGLTAIPKPLPPLPIPGRPGGGSGATKGGSGSAVPGGRDRPDGRPDRPTDRPARCERPDRDNECEQHRKEDEAACTVPIIRYGYARGKACLDSAMIRYGECLRFGVDGIRTPLHGVDTPL